jgi:hypothetical protein
MISNYNHANQYVKLKGRQINVGEGRIFGLSHKRIVPIGKESYNPIIAIYFIGDEHEHYIPRSCYLIAKTYAKHEVARLEALMEIMSFRQGNKFTPGALISTILAVEKDEVNWVVWFSKKL